MAASTGAYSTADAEPWPDHDWDGCAEHGGHHTAAQLRHRVLPLPDQSRYGPPTGETPAGRTG